MASRADLQHRLATAFSAQGWPYELDVGSAILDGMPEDRTPDPATLAARVPPTYFARHGLTRHDLAAVLARALGAEVIEPSPSQTVQITMNDNRHSIQISSGAVVSNANLNTSGNQLVLHADAPREDLLEAVRLLVSAGLDGEWNGAAAGDLAELVAGRDDIALDDIRAAATQGAGGEQADRGKVKALLGKVAVGTTTSLVTTGIIAALGALT